MTVLVIGGGPAGAAAAWRLATTGGRVILIERSATAHDTVCGEFLGGDAGRELAALGIDPGAFGAPQLDRILLAAGGRAVTAPLPFPAWGLSRRCLDDALLQRAAAAGAEIVRGRAVRRLDRDGVGWRAALADGRIVHGASAVLATGKHAFPGVAREAPRPSAAIGFKLHLRPAPGDAAGLTGTVALALFPGGYAGLQPIEDGRLNLCLVVGAAPFARLERSWRRLLDEVARAAPGLGAVIAAATPLWPRPLAVAGIPYGFVRRGGAPAGLVCIGDQAAVIPSFTGDGLAIALRSAAIAAEGWRDGLPAAAVHRRIRQAVAWPMRMARLLSAAAGTAPGRAIALRLFGAAPGLLPVLAAATRLASGDDQVARPFNAGAGMAEPRDAISGTGDGLRRDGRH